jgi:hypothetical protein
MEYIYGYMRNGGFGRRPDERKPPINWEKIGGEVRLHYQQSKRYRSDIRFTYTSR